MMESSIHFCGLSQQEMFSSSLKQHAIVKKNLNKKVLGVKNSYLVVESKNNITLLSTSSLSVKPLFQFGQG